MPCANFVGRCLKYCRNESVALPGLGAGSDDPVARCGVGHDNPMWLVGGRGFRMSGNG